jgi:hypothetical protein
LDYLQFYLGASFLAVVATFLGEAIALFLVLILHPFSTQSQKSGYAQRFFHSKLFNNLLAVMIDTIQVCITL